MMRKLAATAIAVNISIPLIPFLVTSIERLTGTHGAMVFLTDAWKVASLGKARGCFLQ